MNIRIERSQVSEDGGRTWEPDWRIIDTSVEPSDYNYYGLLAYGCADPFDALSCAIERGWLIPGRDS